MSHRKNSPSRPSRSVSQVFFITLVLAMLLTVGGCATSDERSEVAEGPEETPTIEPIPEPTLEEWTETKEMPTPPAPEPKKPQREPGTAPDNGDFIAKYSAVSNPSYQEMEHLFRNVRLLENIADDLNRRWALPYDVTLTLRQCNTVNAMYEPKEKRISMCYEFVEFVEQLFIRNVGTKEQAAQGIAGAVYFTFYHEIGHALIDVLDLPTTGQPEELADELSTYVLISGGDEGERMAFNGAKFWALLAQHTQPSDSMNQDADEHLSPPQRYFNILCWLYGSNPEKYTDLGRNLPERRAAKCPGDFERFIKAWNHVLSPYVKQ